jgi:predicted P-loop ATPase
MTDENEGWKAKALEVWHSKTWTEPKIVKLVPRPQWVDITKEGDPKRTYRNAREAIKSLGVTCRYDRFHDRMLVGGHPIDEWAGELTDNVIMVLRQFIIDKFDFDPGKDHIADAATALCLENGFDPVLDYLNGLDWDGVERLDEWLATYLGAENTPLNAAIGRLALTAAVRRVRQPGCKFDHILTLEGEEGTKKSTSIVTLAGVENFSDQTILTQSDKEQQELVRGVWLFEIADLAGMRRADVEKIKAFASRTHDRARPAYGRRRFDAPRRCIFIATTNEDQYLQSQTGNRRFWPVKTGVIDIESLARDRDHLWAEAAYAEAKGNLLVLPAELWKAASAAQEQRRLEDPWDDILTSILATLPGGIYASDADSDEERITTAELFKALEVPATRAQAVEAQRLKRAMLRLGWEGPKKLRFGDKTLRGYFRKVEKEGERAEPAERRNTIG